MENQKPFDVQEELKRVDDLVMPRMAMLALGIFLLSYTLTSRPEIGGKFAHATLNAVVAALMFFVGGLGCRDFYMKAGAEINSIGSDKLPKKGTPEFNKFSQPYGVLAMGWALLDFFIWLVVSIVAGLMVGWAAPAIGLTFLVIGARFYWKTLRRIPVS